VVLFQILLDSAEPRDAGRPSCLLQSAGGEANRILLASALSSMHIICPNRVSRREWIIAWVASALVSIPYLDRSDSQKITSNYVTSTGQCGNII